jgi:hypothetical protein
MKRDRRHLYLGQARAHRLRLACAMLPTMADEVLQEKRLVSENALPNP